MLKSRKQKFVALLMGLFVTDVVSVTITRFDPWLNRILNPQLKEVYMVKRILLLISSVLLAYGLGVAPVLAKEITFWSRATNQTQLTALVDAWNETHETQIKLTLIPWDDFFSKLGLAMATGTPPDIAAIEVGHFTKYAAEGQMLDITDKAKALPYFKHFIPAHNMYYPFGGKKLYGISFFPDIAVLIYNKNLFRQASLDPENPPSNRAEMKNAIERITALGDDINGFYASLACRGCMYFFGLSQIWASGGNIIDYSANKTTYDDPEVGALLKFYRWMLTSGNVPASAKADTGSGFTTLFKAGKIGMQGVNTPAAADMMNHFGDDVGVTFLPGREFGAGSMIGGDSIGIPAGSKNPDEAWKFIEWMTTEEVQLKYYAGMNMIPTRMDLYDHQVFAKDPRLVKSAKASEFGRVPYLVENAKIVCCSPTAPWVTLVEQSIFEGEYDEVVDELNKEATKILRETQ